MSTKVAQGRVRAGVFHIQYGTVEDYSKSDVAVTDAITNYVKAQTAAGNTLPSLAGTSTRYVPLAHRESGVEIFIPETTVTVPETSLGTI